MRRCARARLELDHVPQVPRWGGCVQPESEGSVKLVPLFVSDVQGEKLAHVGPLARVQFEEAVQRMLDQLERKARHADEVRLARYARALGWRWS
jgi:hypothetical protein